MVKLFETVLYTDAAHLFLNSLDEKAYNKVLYNIEKAKTGTDPELFKKLDGDIWEFRTNYKNQKIRLFAFWDKSNANTIIIATHGIVKKKSKVDKKELEKAKNIRSQYFGNT